MEGFYLGHQMKHTHVFQCDIYIPANMMKKSNFWFSYWEVTSPIDLWVFSLARTLRNQSLLAILVKCIFKITFPLPLRSRMPHQGEFIQCWRKAETSPSRAAHLPAALRPSLWILRLILIHINWASLPCPVLPACMLASRLGGAFKLSGSTWPQAPRQIPQLSSSEGEQRSSQLLSVHSDVKSFLVLNSENDQD